MSGAQSISARRAYGVQRVCRVWGRARSSVYVRRHATRSRASRRRGPVGAATDEVLVGHIRRVLEASPFHGAGYRKAWAKLRVERIRTSQERVRRLMREHGLQAPYRAGHAHGPKAHDGTITTAAPNVIRSARGRPASSWPSITVRPSASVSMRPSVAPGLRPWSRFAKVSANASAPSATGSPMGCVCATTTARTTWLTISNRRSRSSGLRVPRASCERPKVMGSRSVSSVRERRISCGCGASRPSKTSAWPCSRSNGHTTNSGCWRSTTIGVQPKCDAISTGWTRPRRSDYLQTTVQEPWGATPFS